MEVTESDPILEKDLNPEVKNAIDKVLAEIFSEIVIKPGSQVIQPPRYKMKREENGILGSGYRVNVVVSMGDHLKFFASSLLISTFGVKDPFQYTQIFFSDELINDLTSKHNVRWEEYPLYVSGIHWKHLFEFLNHETIYYPLRNKRTQLERYRANGMIEGKKEGHLIVKLFINSNRINNEQ